MPEVPIIKEIEDGRCEATIAGIVYRWRMRHGAIVDPVWIGTQGVERPLKSQATIAELDAISLRSPRPEIRRDGGWYRVTFAEQERAYPRDYRWKISSRDAALPIEQRVYAEAFCGTWGEDLHKDILHRLWALTQQEPAAEQQELFG